MLDLIICSVINLVLLIGVIDALVLTTKVYSKLQHRIDYLNANLVARYYLTNDIRDSLGAYVNASNNIVLQLGTHSIIYSIRESIIPHGNYMRSYALYRDDLTTQAIALVEGITDYNFKISAAIVKITLNFKNGSKMELICVMRKFKG